MTQYKIPDEAGNKGVLVVGYLVQVEYGVFGARTGHQRHKNFVRMFADYGGVINGFIYHDFSP